MIAQSNTLCWDCQRAIGLNQCEWAMFGEPVRGWNAESRLIPSQVKGIPTIQTYEVKDCPKFIRDEPRRQCV